MSCIQDSVVGPRDDPEAEFQTWAWMQCQELRNLTAEQCHLLQLAAKALINTDNITCIDRGYRALDRLERGLFFGANGLTLNGVPANAISHPDHPMFSSDIRNQTAVNVTIFGKPFDYVVRVVSHEMDHYWFWETGVWDPNDGVCYTEECQAMTEFLAEKTEDMCVELVSELPSDTPIE